MGKVDFAEHGLRAAYRAFRLGYAGIARNSDRVSIDHFLSESELDKACYREKQVN